MILETERLRLRPPEAGDAQAIFEEYAQDPAVTRYMIWRPHQSLDETHAFLDRCAASLAEGSAEHWGITVPPDDRVVGMISLRVRGQEADLGYVLARRLWGRGLVAEAGRAVLAHAFGRRKVELVFAYCDVDNAASARVMEKMGMRRTGVVPRKLIHPNIADAPRDALRYELRATGRSPT